MLYYLSELREFFSPLNVFGYITFRAGGAFGTALGAAWIFGAPFVRWLKRRQITQEVRTWGPPTHLAKSGTPTMGGLLLGLCALGAAALWARPDNRFVLLSLIAMTWLMAVGWLDDYYKLIQKNPRGIRMSAKLAAQMALALGVLAYLWLAPPNPAHRSSVNLPYFKNFFLEFGSLYLPFALVLFLGSANGVNLTDGLDGLAVGAISIAALTFGIFAYLAGHAVFSEYLRIVPVPGAGELAVVLAAIAGAGLGFLWFNAYPAEMFMGDTGSLFLGGALGLAALCVKQELLLVIVGGLFAAEAASVLLQVASYRWRGGKRIFRMAPLHHHFELSGWAEPKVVTRFWIVQIVLSLLALASLKLR